MKPVEKKKALAERATSSKAQDRKLPDHMPVK
jgi:hypothetical protein